MDDTAPDDPAVESEFTPEGVSDVAVHIGVDFAGVGVDGGDDAPLAERVDTDECVADGERLARPGGFGVGGDARNQEVRTKPSDVVAEGIDGSVGGDEEVENIEPLGPVISRELGVLTRAALDDFFGLDRKSTRLNSSH